MMKGNGALLKSVAISLICLCCSVAFGGEYSLDGVWTGVDSSGECHSLVFYEDGSAALLLNGNVLLDGKAEGGSVVWELDRTKNPMHLDVIATNADRESMALLFIVEFISDKKIRVKRSDDMTARPTAFSESDTGNQIVLDKE